MVKELRSTGAALGDEKLVFYESARNEMISRITLRDQALVAYIATAGAYFGLFVDGRIPVPNGSSVLVQSAIVIVLPILSLVFTYVILQHHIMIGKLGEYTRSVFPAPFNHWDHTYALWKDKRYLSARTVAQALLLILPIAYTAMFAINVLPHISTPLDRIVVIGVLLFDLIVLLMIVRLQLWALSLRRQTDFPSDP